MANIDRAIKLAQRLQKVVMGIAEEEKDLAARQASTDYPAEKLADFVNEEGLVLIEEEEIAAIHLLDMTNQLLYALLDYNRDEIDWHDEDDFDERSQLKLREAMLDWDADDDAAAAWGKMTDKERRAYFRKRDKLNKKSRSKRIRKKAIS